MSDWRERGEVPDSQEEGDDSFSDIETQLPVRPSISATQGAEDIWAFPGSDDEEQGNILPAADFPPFSPRSSLRARSESVTISLALAEDNSKSQVKPSPPNHPETRASSPSASSLGDVASRNNQDTADAPSLTDGDPIARRNNNNAASFVSASAVPREQPTTTGGSVVHQQDAESDTADATSRHGRRLRPRNLIQKKPYFYDRVHYSNTFRRHGLIPVNVITETERRDAPEASSDAASWDGDRDQDSQDIDIPPGTDNIEAGGFTAPLREHDMLDADQPCLNVPQPPARTVIASLPSSPTTAADDDQDLPDLDQILGRLPTSRTNSAMRDASQVQTSTQRLRRRDIIYSDSPEPNTAVGRKPKSAGPVQDWWDSDSQQSVPREVINRQSSSPKTPPRPSCSDSVVSISSQEIESQNEHSQESREGSESRSGAESDTHQVVTQYRRRIRGVLPASWLRLDQQTSKSGSGRSPKRKPRHQIAHQRQRGIALTRTMTHDAFASNTIPLSLDEDSPIQYTTDDMPERQTRITPSQNSEREDEGLSDDPVVEEDHISPVVVGSKRQLRLPKTSKRNGKRAKVSTGSRSRLVQAHSKQQAITGFLHPRSPNPARSLPADYLSDGSMRIPNKPQRNAVSKPKPRLQSPVLLSILDTIEPDAPRFMRIAARSAKQTLNQGRSSVQQKRIKLAARQDQIDVMSIMEKWRSGLIRQRPSVTAASKSNHKRHQIANANQKPSSEWISSSALFSTSRGTSRKLVKCRGENGSASYRRNGSDTGIDTTFTSTVGVDSVLPSLPLRKAQLEVSEKAGEAMVSFRSRKGALDRIFNKQRQKKPASCLTENSNTTGPSHGATEAHTIGHTPSRVAREKEQKQRRPRLRKSMKPSRLDVTAPQYTHADDPLPVGSSVFTTDASREKSRLHGLGPYGTRYTHHFEIFPLAPGLQLPTSTLLGSGVFKTLVEDSYIGKAKLIPHFSIRLGDHVFELGSWTPNASSEIGLLFDTLAGSIFDILAGRLEESQEEEEVIRGAIGATHSAFEYVQKVLDVAETEPLTPLLIPRLQDVLRSFIDRLDNVLTQSSFLHAAHRHLVLNLLDRVLLMSFAMTRHCQRTPQPLDEHSNTKPFMLSPARLMISTLLRCGLDKVKQVYRDVSRVNRRGRTLGGSAVEVHSWTLLIKTFKHANSPQISFWSALETALLKPEVLSGTDALEFERIWETMFTLLPLFEFDDSGRIATEERYKAENEGWAIPQKLIRRVFQLYQENDQQTASFNSYCRALISRCHYLVRQWGWLRSASVVGVIFDFFGSRSLAHLRNEEVYQSPRFLENLAEGPVLEVEADDFCFHIFLKLLAISIKNLEHFGSQKDIRNLIARTIPNHNRSYLKEHTVHERDLAALRNHHDLIGTLFWAAPPGVRPSVAIIEKLVTPANSHKEACLINIRAWAQLARFIVSSGEAKSSFEPFEDWRDAVFQQMLVQFGNIAADVHLQQLTLSEDKRKFITQSVVDATINKNKAAVMDVIRLSLAASLDVMRCASDLEAATHCLSTRHLKQVFDYFKLSPFELDWSILRTALTILDTFVSRIEDFKASHHSQQSESQLLESAQADETFCALGQEISHSYFSMARCILSLPTEADGFLGSATADKTWCVRQVTTLSARMGIGFINGSLMFDDGLFRLSDMFKSGNFCLFSGQLQAIDPSHRQHFMLFISTLLKHELDDFSDVEFNICEVWLLALVTPIEYIKYENLVEIQRHCYANGFIPNDMVDLPTRPSYKTNQLLFEFAVSSMRRKIRRADPQARRVLAIEYSRTLKLVMKQMRNDLSVTYETTSQHRHYVEFVQGIISSIKAHASDLCPIDNFFLQSSREYYHPPIQDPQLQIAGMLSYGIRIEEGDPRAAHELFYLLFNNFKHALRKGNLAPDVRMLREGMRHKSILAFVLGKMLPAILGVSFLDSSSFVLLDVYTEAVRRLLGGPILPRQLDSDDLPHVIVTIRAIVEGLRIMRLRSEILTGSQLHILRQALVISNALWPSLLIVNAERPGDLCLIDIASALRQIASFATVAQEYLHDLTEMRSDNSPDADLLFQGLGVSQPLVFDEHVKCFIVNIKDDIAKTWVFSPERISIQMPTNPKGLTQEDSCGVKPPDWVVKDIVCDIYNHIQHWYWQWGEFK